MIKFRLTAVFSFFVILIMVGWPGVSASNKAPEVIDRIELPSNTFPNSLLLLPDGKTLAINYDDADNDNRIPTVSFLNIETKAVLNATYGGEIGPVKPIIDQTGSIFYLIGSNGFVFKDKFPFEEHPLLDVHQLMLENVTGVALNHAGTRFYITNQARSRLLVVSSSTFETENTISKFGLSPTAVVINKDDSRVYVANSISNDVAIFDAAKNSLLTTIPNVGSEPCALALSPDNSKLYVANKQSNDLTVIDTAKNEIITRIPNIGQSPWAIAVSPNGRKVYVTNNVSNDVAIIDTRKNMLTGKIAKVGQSPRGLAITPNGKILYVANIGSHDIAVIALKK